jgi:hypothetical protein
MTNLVNMTDALSISLALSAPRSFRKIDRASTIAFCKAALDSFPKLKATQKLEVYYVACRLVRSTPFRDVAKRFSEKLYDTHREDLPRDAGGAFHEACDYYLAVYWKTDSKQAA